MVQNLVQHWQELFTNLHQRRQIREFSWLIPSQALRESASSTDSPEFYSASPAILVAHIEDLGLYTVNRSL